MTDASSAAVQATRVALPQRLSLLSAESVDELVRNTERELERLETEIATAEQRLREESAHASWAISQFERVLAGLRNEAELEAKVLLSVAEHQAQERIDEARALANRHGRQPGAYVAFDDAPSDTGARVIDLRSPHEQIRTPTPMSGVPFAATAPPAAVIEPPSPTHEEIPPLALETTVEEQPQEGASATVVADTSVVPAASDEPVDVLAPDQEHFWSAEEEPMASRLRQAITPSIALQIAAAIIIVLVVVLFH